MKKTSAANEAVIKIRKIRTHLNSNKESIPIVDFNKTVVPFLKNLAAVEEELYQVKNQSGQDPLNFPIKLNNRLASLRRSVEHGDAKPTNGAYTVFEELTEELDTQLGMLKGVIDQQLEQVNTILTTAQIKEIE